MMCEVYENDRLSCSKVYEWFLHFKNGYESLEIGRPMTSQSNENVNRVCTLLCTSRRTSIKNTANELSIAVRIVHKIMHEDLGVWKVY